MTAGLPEQRVPKQFAREDAAHEFAIGQRVRLKGGFGKTPTDIFLITGKLPARANSPQYRIRNEEERHERVTTQEDLEPVSNSQSASSLMERTFGHGQGTTKK
jgi:hypothetical protein